jgi:hypothetical protein
VRGFQGRQSPLLRDCTTPMINVGDQHSEGTGAPFPADPHYDAKGWELCVAMRGPGRVLFWNVAPLARQGNRVWKSKR